MSVAGLAKRLELELQVSPSRDLASLYGVYAVVEVKKFRSIMAFAPTSAGSSCVSYPHQSSSIVLPANARARLKAHRAAALRSI